MPHLRHAVNPEEALFRLFYRRVLSIRGESYRLRETKQARLFGGIPIRPAGLAEKGGTE